MKCSSCHKQDAELLTPWQHLRKWMFGFFAEDINDLREDTYTQGFGKGYEEGFRIAKGLGEENLKMLFQGHECPKGCPIDSLVDPFNVLEVHKTGVFLINNERLTHDETKQLKEEVRWFKATRLYSLIEHTLRQKSIDKGFKESLNWEVTMAGKMMNHCVGIIKSMVETIDALVVDMKK